MLNGSEQRCPSNCGKMAFAMICILLLSNAKFISSRLSPPRPQWKEYEMSLQSQLIHNPVWANAETKVVPKNPHLKPIYLDLPSVEGLEPNEVAIETLERVVEMSKHQEFNKYAPSVGLPAAREAIVKQFSTPSAPFTVDDIFMTTGAGHSLQMAIQALASPTQNILVPNPGWNYYRVLCHAYQIEPRLYRVNIATDGGTKPGGSTMDLADLEAQIDEKTRAILVNNPTNPHGVIFDKTNLEGVLRIAEKYKLPIISDEAFRGMEHAHPGHEGHKAVGDEDVNFHPLLSLAPKVPMIVCDGVGKRHLLPGWRLGWLIVHDHREVLRKVRQGIANLCQIIAGASPLIQAALPAVLTQTPKSFYAGTNLTLAENARIFHERLAKVPGLRPFWPKAGWFMLIELVPEYFAQNTDTLIEQLKVEQSVHCFPGSYFGVENGFRISLVLSKDTIEEASRRMEAFFKSRQIHGRL